MRIIRVFAPVIIMMLSAGFAYGGGSTAFTYQGRLLDAGEPANGLFDFKFLLFRTDIGADPIAGPEVSLNLPVTDGPRKVSG